MLALAPLRLRNDSDLHTRLHISCGVSSGSLTKNHGLYENVYYSATRSGIQNVSMFNYQKFLTSTYILFPQLTMDSSPGLECLSFGMASAS